MIMSRFSPALKAWILTSLAMVLVGLTILIVAPNYANVRAGRDDAGYLQSSDCRKCHEMNYSTWHSTFHWTMTQETDQASLLGDFEHYNTHTYQEVRAEIVRENERNWKKQTGVDVKKQKI